MCIRDRLYYGLLSPHHELHAKHYEFLLGFSHIQFHFDVQSLILNHISTQDPCTDIYNTHIFKMAYTREVMNTLAAS